MMNVLFLTMGHIDINKVGLYNDLMRKFRDCGHNVYIVTPLERRMHQPTILSKDGGVYTLRVRTLNVQKTNVIEKGLGQISIEFLFERAINKYFKGVKFDLILYSTPPITLTKAIESAKRANSNAKTYLMLKDIFPQNAVDLGMLTTTGIKGFLYRSFRRKEKKMYALSDFIGCMSPANVQYLLRHNPEINPEIVEICPNSFAVPEDEHEVNDIERVEIRKKYHLPINKPIFIYGGNLGKPQGISFLLECLKANKQREDCHFLVVGDGTEYPMIEEWINKEKPMSVSLYKRLPKEDYDKLADACDIGLIFLDYRFTIPNYPSRLLPYLMNKKPILAVTDPNCDTGSIAVENGYGMWAPSNNVEAFSSMVDKMLASDLKRMGDNGYQFYLNNYTVQHTYDVIMKHC